MLDTYVLQAIGFGHVTSCRNKGEAFQKAKERAVTDGLRKAIEHLDASREERILDCNG